MSTTASIGVCVVGLIVLIGLLRPGGQPAATPNAILRGAHMKRGETAEIHELLDPPNATLKLFIKGKQVAAEHGRADPK